MQPSQGRQGAQFLSPAEVATELRVSPSAVLRLICSGRLTAIAVSERIYWNFGATSRCRTLTDPTTARGFSFTVRMPGSADSGPAEIALAEVWEADGPDACGSRARRAADH